MIIALESIWSNIRFKSVSQIDQSRLLHNNILPNNGIIDWKWSLDKILKFIRALYSPFHTCALAKVNDNKIEIKCAKRIYINKIKSFNPGKVLDEKSPNIIQCSDGLIELTDWGQI